MDKFNGKILFREIPHSKPIQRFVAKQIENWMKHFRRKNEIESYKVEFDRFQKNGLVGCHIEIKTSGRQLKSSNYGRGIHQAFSQCLKNIA